MDESVTAPFRTFAADSASSELDGALLLNALLDRHVDANRIRHTLSDLARQCDQPETPWAFLAGSGFAGNRGDYDALDNSRMDRVLEHRRGIPITLGVVLIEVARAMGARAWGIGFPGHFLVRVNDTLIDPFEMQVTTQAHWQQLASIPESGLAAAFAPVSPVAVLLRMLNNVKQHYARESRWDLALDVVDCQRAVSPEVVALAVERSELWLRLGAVQMARSSMTEAIDLAGRVQPELTGVLRKRLAALGKAGEVIH